MHDMDNRKSQVDTAVGLISRKYSTEFKPKVTTVIGSNSFYHIVGDLLGKRDPNTARKAVCDFQEKHDIEYGLFEPENSASSQKPLEILNKELSISRRDNGKTTRRDIHAETNMLNRSIVMLIFRDRQDIQEETFIPDIVTENAGPLYLLLMFTSDTFFELHIKNDKHLTTKAEHQGCFWKRYRRNFDEVFLDGKNVFEGDFPNKWKMVYCTKRNASFFEAVSTAIYGTENYAQYIMELMFLQLHRDKQEFYTMLVDDSDTKTKDKITAHCHEIRNGTIQPTDGDIYAMATVLHTDIYIATQTDSENCSVAWRRYFPLLEGRTANKSYLVLLMQLGANNRHEYGWLMPNEKSDELDNPLSMCTCTEKPPKTTGCLATVFKELPHLVDTILYNQETCCPAGERHGSHAHQGKAIDPTKDERETSQLLGNTGRMVCCAGLTFNQCIHGAGHRDYNAPEPTEANLHTKASELGVPIYIFHPVDATWTKFLPEEQSTKCRYYITLSENNDGETFSLVFPRKGCNCQYIPPMVCDEAEDFPSEYRRISATNRHFPLIEFFEDCHVEKKFDEERESISDFGGREDVYKLPDMKNRCIEESDDQLIEGDNFFRCISKEIIGNELIHKCIRNYICNELRKFPKCYKEFMHHTSKVDLDLWVDVKTKSLERNLRVEDVHITAAATFFQTEIHILKIDERGPTWKIYLPVRRKLRPKTIPKRISKCSQMNNQGDYYVTLFLDLTGKYHRIFPRRKTCNCEIPKPTNMRGNRFDNGNMRIITDSRKIYWMLLSTSKRLEYSLSVWMYLADELIRIGEEAIQNLRKDRESSNYATIVGGSVGTVGRSMVTGGIASLFGTMGASSPVLVTGIVLATVGTFTSTVSQWITERRGEKSFTEFYFYLIWLIIVEEELTENRSEFEKAVEKSRLYMADILKSQPQRKNDFLKPLSAVLEIFRYSLLSGIRIIPKVLSRVTLRTSGLVFGGAALFLDVGTIMHAFQNIKGGNQTTTTKDIQKTLKALSNYKLHLKDWAYGNDG